MTRCIETLESRHLPSVALALTVGLLDAAGSSVESVEAGQDFLVEVMASDARWHARGLQGLYLDLEWDESDMRATGFQVREDWPAWRSGRLIAGRLENAGGMGANYTGDAVVLTLNATAADRVHASDIYVGVGRGGIGMEIRGRWQGGNLAVNGVVQSPSITDAVLAGMPAWMQNRAWRMAHGKL